MPASVSQSPLRLILGSVLILVVCVGLIMVNAHRDRGGDAPELRFYCAAGLRPVVEAVIEDYEAESGVRVIVDYAGSGSLLGTIRAARSGDLYLAADTGYLDQARELGLVEEVLHLASQRPAVVVRQDNPKGLAALDDLLRDDVRFAIADPKAAAIGRATRSLLEKAGRWKDVLGRAHAMEATVNQVANLVKIGTVDAAITWNATAYSYPELEVVDLPELAGGERRVAVGVLTASEVPTSALRFARYLAARDRGLLEFKRRGLQPVDGDVWAEIPEVTLYCGAMLRPGIEGVIASFERREGCDIVTKFDGCGRLVSAMKAGAPVDAYVSCDRSFMTMVQDRFAPPLDLTENDIVIVVAHGNPKGIGGVADLARSDLRVGRTNPEFSALGALTRDILTRAGHRRVLDAHPGGAATADELIAGAVAGALDAGIVYRSNVLAHEGNSSKLSIVELGLEDAVAYQNYARSLATDHAFLVERLFERLRGVAARERFSGVGFRWTGR